MFDEATYIKRRQLLKKNVKSGIIILPGNEESPMNYSANMYAFRQDSTFLYYFGIDEANLVGVIDVDENKDYLFGDDFTVEDIVWMGPQKTIKEKAATAGVKNSKPLAALQEMVDAAIAGGRAVHYLPQYRWNNILMISSLLGIKHDFVKRYCSVKLIESVVAQRSIKSSAELKEIEYALDIAYEMHTYAIRVSRPGLFEREIAGAIEGIALSMGNGVSFPVIFSINGQTLHNHYHGNKLKDGDLIVNDSGAQSLMYYASDITRSFPAGKKFSQRQKEIYSIVLKSQMEAIKMIKPGVRFKDVHLRAAKEIATGLRELGLMKGSVNEAVKAGAHALFFPHGLGHMLGLDVHDMEGLGENFVGYNKEVKRSDQFGLAYLRLAKPLQPGFVFTVEPGIYFIPELIDKWKSEKKHSKFINYEKVEGYKNFGGIRIEDNVVVDKRGYRVLGKPIPKTIDDVEALR